MSLNIRDTNLRFSHNPGHRGKTTALIIHNTAGTFDDTVEGIHEFHRDGRGWAGIAYHFVIDGQGQVYHGRPEEWNGGHCLDGWNYKSLGIVVAGNFEKYQPRESQVDSLVELCAHLCQKYALTVADIWGHRDKQHSKPTACPGRNLYARLPEVRSRVAKILGETDPADMENVDWNEAPVIRQSDRGLWVSRLQLLLSGTGRTITVDGVFGPKTELEVRAFQAAHGLHVDGVVGENTWAKLVEESVAPNEPPTRPEVPMAKLTLDQARNLQRTLESAASVLRTAVESAEE